LIELYAYTSPNARKVQFMLDEVGLPYVVRWVDISAGDQHTAEFRRINPNGKIPAIIDPEGPGGQPITLFESGAILLYLADKTGKLLPTDPVLRWETITWVFWQMANQGPMLGQAAHFVTHAKKRGITDSYAEERYVREARRLYQLLEDRLRGREFMVGNALTIADIACFPWVRVSAGQGIDLDGFPEVKRWSDALAARPAAKKKLAVPDGIHVKEDYTDDASWKALFGGGEAACPIRR
jgi:GST-like protein